MVTKMSVLLCTHNYFKQKVLQAKSICCAGLYGTNSRENVVDATSGKEELSL